MSDRSHLVPQQIVNANGVTTTVHVNPNKGAQAAPTAQQEKMVKPVIFADQGDVKIDYALYGDPYQTSEERKSAIKEALEACDSPNDFAERLHAEGWSTPEEIEMTEADEDAMHNMIGEAVSALELYDGRYDATSIERLAGFLEDEGLFRDVSQLRSWSEEYDQRDEFIAGYVSSLVESVPEGDDPDEVRSYSMSDIEDDAVEALRKSAGEFYDKHIHDITSYGLRRNDAPNFTGMELAGHDLAMTRNSEGVSYSDRELGALGDRLRKACDDLPEQQLLPGDNGSLFASS